MKPTVLVATTSKWYPTARLAMALDKAGFIVKAVCPSRHPMLKTKVVEEKYRYHGLLPLQSFASAIAEAKADLIVPGDDLATAHLHRLHERETASGTVGSAIGALIERSLGLPENFPIAYSRTAFMNIARGEDVRVPQSADIHNVEELRQWAARVGLPFVLKADGTSGGEGVRVARTLDEAERDFRSLQAPPLLARAAKRTLFDQDPALLRPAIFRERSIISAQGFIRGTEATSAVACWDGQILASLHFEVIHKTSAAGHSTVVRLLESAEMAMAAERIARRLGLSGLYGFDFILESGTRNAYLIEINPRSTQVGHLALGPGRDIPAALYSAVSGQPIRESPAVTEKDTIALFPQEWFRDSASSYLRSAYHDVPWEEPELIRASIRAKKKQQAWYMQKVPVRGFSALGLPRT